MKQIPNFSNYRASEDGTIFSVKRATPTVCKITRDGDGPPRVQIQRDDSVRNSYVPVALLVASAFHGARDDAMAIMHLNGDFGMPSADNLVWVDPRDPSTAIEDAAAIPGFPGYFALTSGRIFSARRGRIVRELTHTPTNSGGDWSVVMFDASGQERLVRVAHVVCSAFYGDENGTVEFADGDRKNFSAENLSWAIGSEDLKVIPEGAKPIPSFPGYFVNEDAVVYTSIARQGSVFRLTPSLNERNYWCVTLRRDGAQIRKCVHVLVALAFLGEKSDPSLHARHLDDDRNNNHVSNIAWGTHQDNMEDRDRNGGTARGPKLAALTDDDIRTIRARCDAGEKPHYVAQDYGLRGPVIANIARRKTFLSVTT